MNITELKENEVFIFGSNLEGRHGAGAALYAQKHFGAIYGKGVGFGFEEKSYAIPTRKYVKNAKGKWTLVTMPLSEIFPYVDNFLKLTTLRKNKTFLVTKIGTGFAGFTDSEIAPMFERALAMKNVLLPESFVKILEENKKEPQLCT